MQRQLWDKALGVLLATLTVLILLFASVNSALAAGGDLRSGWPVIVARSGDQLTTAAVTDSAGNLILVGSDTATNKNLLIAKFKADGSGLAWPLISYDHLGGEDVATAVALDAGGDIIVTGYVHNGSNFDILTAKYRGTDGALLWRHVYDGPAGGDDYPTALALDSLGNIYVGGYGQGQGNKDDALVLKFAPTGPEADGTPFWSYVYDGPDHGNDRLFALATGASGLAFCGESETALSGDFDAFTFKINYSGQALWPQAQRYTDTGNGRGNALAVDAAGRVIMLGYVANGTDAASRDLFLAQYPASFGPADWVVHYDGGFEDEGSVLSLSADGSIFIAGQSFRIDSAFDIYMARYDASGQQQWSDLRNSNNGNNDQPFALLPGSNGDLFLLGYSNDAQGSFDQLELFKYRQNGTFLWQTSYAGSGRNNRPAGIGLAADGDLLVGAWSDRGVQGSPDVDLVALRYDAGQVDPPTGLTATTLSNSEISLSWQNNDPFAETINIEMRTASGSYVSIASLPASATSYNHSALTADIRYYYRIQAVRSGVGASPYSVEATARTTLINYAAPVWQYLYAGSDGGDDDPAAISSGPDLQPVVAGNSFSLLGGYDYLTLKLDRNDPSQELWKIRYNDGDNQGDVATDVAVDSQNRVLVTGYSSLWGGGTSNTNDIYTLAYPANGGAKLWDDQYNGPAGDDDKSLAVAVQRNAADELAVIGYGKNAAWNNDLYLIKYQADGTRAWAATPWDGGGDDLPAAVAFGPDGRIFVGGQSSNGNNDDLLLLCYNGSDGSLIWQARIDGPAAGNDRVVGLRVDDAGDLYVAATSDRLVNDRDIYLAKFAGNGDGLPDAQGVGGAQRLWEYWTGAPGGFDRVIGVEIDPLDGDLLLGAAQLTAVANHDLLLVRLDPAGDGAGAGKEIWRHLLDLPDDEIPTAMTIDPSGITTIIAEVDSGGWTDMLAVQWNHQGEVVAASRYDGPDGREDLPRAVTSNDLGETFVAGSTFNAAGNADLLVFRLENGLLQAPKGLRATQLYSEVQLNWVDITTGESGFELERALGSCEAPGPFAAVASLPAGSETQLDTGLNIGSQYCYRLRSVNGAGEVSRWAQVGVQTADALAPTGLSASLQQDSNILLAWIDNNTGAAGYEFVLERCSGAACDFSSVETQVLDAVQVTDPQTGQSAYLDKNVCAGNAYRYRIFARKPGLWSSPYSAATDSAGVTPVLPVAPSALQADLVNELEVDLSWLDMTAAEDRFLIERCNDLAANCNDAAFNPLASLSSLAGAVIQYRLDKSSWNGTNDEVVDLSGHNNHGRSLGAVTNPYGRFAGAGSLGANDRISTSLVLDQSSTSSGATFSAWVKPGAASGQAYLFDTDDGGNDWSLLHDGSTWQLTNGTDGILVDTGIQVDINIWQHVAVSFDPLSGVRFAKNGSDQFTDAQIDFDTSSSAVQIGYQDDPVGTLLQLTLDEAVWTLGTASLLDSSPAGNNGTPQGGALSTADGYKGRAGQFDGSSAYIETPLIIDQSASTNGITMEAWVYPGDAASYTWRQVLSTDNNSQDWGILQYGNRWYIATGTGWYASGLYVDAGQWQHLVAVFEPGKGATLYKNGVPGVTQGLSYGNSSPLVIGRDANSASQYFVGKIDEVIVTDHPLSAQEAKDRSQRHSFSGLVDEVAVFDRSLDFSQFDTLYQHGLSRYQDRSISVNQTYSYRVRADKAASCVADWPTAASTILEVTTTPPAPILQAQADNIGRVRLSWISQTSTQTSFQLERCQGVGCSSFSLLAAGLDAAATTSLDTTTCAGQSYGYRLTALQNPGWGASAPSQAIEVALPSLTAPTNVTASDISEGEITLHWSYPTAAANSFEIGYCATVTGCSQPSDFISQLTNGLSADNLLLLHLDESIWANGSADLLDASGSNNPATAHNDLGHSLDGRFGGAAEFDGLNDYISTPVVLDQSESGPGATFELWVYPVLNDGNQRHLISTENGGADWSIIQQNGFWYVFNGQSSYNTSIAVDLNQWQQLAVSFDPAGSVVFYKNGGLSIDDIFTVNSIGFDSSTSNIFIGRHPNSTYAGYHFAGRVDEVAVYARPLSGEEIQERYLGGSSLTIGILEPAVEYIFQVQALRNDSCASTSPTVQINAPVSTLAVTAPTGLSVEARGTTGVLLNWTLPTTTETVLRLERCLGFGTACDEDAEFNDFSSPVLLPAGSRSYLDESICAESTYTYRLRTERQTVPLWQSGWISVERQALVVGEPTSFVASGLSESEIEIMWAGGDADTAEYVVQRCVGTDLSCASPTEVIRSSGARLVLHMDETLWDGSPGEVVDASGAGNHATRSGTPTTLAGHKGRAGSFNGSTDSLQTPLILDETATGKGVTIAAWVYPTLSDNYSRYVASSENGGFDWGFSHRQGVWYIDTGEANRSTGVAVDLNSWQFISVSFIPGIGVSLIKNSGQNAGETYALSLIGYDTSTAALTVGRRASSTSYSNFAGLIDELAVYPAVLSNVELQRLYAERPYGFVDSGLDPATDYYYRLFANKTVTNGCSWSKSIDATAATLSPPLPEQFAVSATGTTWLDLAWIDKSGSETAYQLQRCDDNQVNCGSFDANFNGLTVDLAPDAQSYTDTGVCPGQVYTYRLRARRTSGSPLWDTGWVYLEAASNSVSELSGFNATRISEVRVDLSWNDLNSDEDGFVLERCAGAGCGGGDFSPIATVVSTETVLGYADDELEPGMTYNYRVKAVKAASCNGGWATGYQGPLEVAASIVVPNLLGATPFNTTGIDLAWGNNAPSATGTLIERCSGHPCQDSFVPLGTAVIGATTYADNQACQGNSYSYRIKSKGEGLSGAATDCWSRRLALTITPFVANSVVEVQVPYDSDMRPDFADLRFYDQSSKRELYYWIAEVVNPGQPQAVARVLLLLGNNPDVFLYYGNPVALESSSPEKFVIYTEDFVGQQIDPLRWIELDAKDYIQQDNGLYLYDLQANYGWSAALISSASFARSAGLELYAEVSLPVNSDGINLFALGWEKDQNTSFYYNALASGLYFNNGQFAAYDGNGIKYPSPAQYYSYTDYQFRVVALAAGGARYLKRKAGETLWTTIIDTSDDAGRDQSPTLRLAIHQAAQDALVSRMQVRKAVTESLVSLGSEEQAAGGCYSYANLWESGFSTEDVWAATPAPVAPTGLSGVLLASGIALNWNWDGDTDAGFIVARCQTGNCVTLVDVATVAAGAHTYLDSSVLPSVTYHYRVRATKPSSCGGWQSNETNELVATTLPGGVSDLQATAVNSRMIRLNWTSLAGDEDGYQLLKQTQTGLFVPLVDLSASATSHSDTLALEPETTYRYQLRAWRIESVGPPEIRSYGGLSNIAEVQTLPWVEGDGVCAQ